jgi:hydroxylysine kinase
MIGRKFGGHHDSNVLIQRANGTSKADSPGGNRSHALTSAMVEAPRFTATTVADAVKSQFGLVGEFTELVSERDQNFRLKADSGSSFVVKITGLAEDPVVTDFQIAALIHLESRGVTGVPRIVRTTSGKSRGAIVTEDGSEICLRVVTWLSGRLLCDVDVTPEIARRFGARLAELDLALEGFSHEGENQSLLWDSQRAGDLRDHLVHVNDKDVRSSVEDVLDDFDKLVKPVLVSLPRQVIHNDANDDNVLLDVDGDVSGIIDFGDMLRAPRVIDVSTAASYLRTPGDPLRLIEPFVTAYDKRNALLKVEFEVLFDLIRTRLSMTLIILYWRLAARDVDDPYRQKSLNLNSNALEFLQSLSAMGRTAFVGRFFQKNK